ncbi:mitochondrial inner membrane translocase subunit TIM44 [Peziza echinospora]|nr:mitochondrial inner membrane translocase subunit TIM44 [Peziza echinospora]
MLYPLRRQVLTLPIARCAAATSPLASRVPLAPGTTTIANHTTARLFSTPRLYGSPLPRPRLEADSFAPRTLALRSNFSSIQQLRQNQTKAGEEKPEEEPKSKSEEPKAKTEEEGPETEDGKKEKAKKEGPPPPPPPHGDKSPFAVFMETFRGELKNSKEWEESTKAIADSAHQLNESAAMKKAREAYEASAKASAEAASKGTETLKKTAKVVGHGAQWTWNTPVVKAGRTVVRKTGEGVAAVTKPVRETKVYQDVSKNVKEVIDDGSSSRYGGFIEKEERRKAKEARELKEKEFAKTHVKMEEDPNAGTNVTLHKDAKWKEQWRDFRDSNKLMQSLFSVKKNLEESENPIVEVGRTIKDRFAGFFAENETAQVIKKFKEMDPSFQVETFLRELREYILPEVLDAYVKGDVKTLKHWFSAAQYSVYEALTKQYTTAGLKSAGQVLDIRNVDIVTAKILEPGDIPVFIIRCSSQEVHVFRDIKTGNLAAGMEDKVQQVTYAIGITRLPEEIGNPETAGWRLIELQKSGRDYI